MNSKKIVMIHRIIRIGIQLCFFVLFPSAFSATFNGMKYIFTQMSIAEPIALTAFLKILIVLSIYTMVFGRFFCGYACAFGSFGDALHGVYGFICQKILKRPARKKLVGKKLKPVKYLVLFLIAILCFAGVSYHGCSPWDVFSMVRAFHFQMDGYLVGILLLIALMIPMAIWERFFCRFICPLGAFFSLLPMYSIRRDRKQCLKGCAGCVKICPCFVVLPQEDSLEVCGECLQCQKCIDICPQKNIKTGIGKIRGNEIWYTLTRAVLLAILFIWLHI